jgi:PAS domain S-box-containing protein
MKGQRRAIIVFTVAFGLLIFFFARSRVIDSTEHEQFLGTIRALRAHDHRLDRQMLRRVAGTVKDDVGEQTRTALAQLDAELRQTPGFLNPAARKEIRALASNQQSALQLKTALVDRLETELRALDRAMLELRQTGAEIDLLPADVRQSLESRAELEQLLRDAVAANGAPGALHARAAQLPPNLDAPAFGRAVDAIEGLLKARTIANGTRDQFLQIDVGRLADELEQAYIAHVDRGTTRANRYRGLLLGAAVLLLIGLLITILRLARSSEALRSMNDGLEERVRERTAALTHTQARTTAIIEAAQDAMVSFDAEGTITEWNQASAQTFGRDVRQALGSPVTQLFDVSESARLEELTREARSSPPHHRIEVCARRSDGAAFPCELVIALTGAGAYTLYLRDITERKQLERLKNEFVSTVSHELRTPLTSVRGSLGLLEGGLVGPLPAKATELVKIARSNTDRLIRLINDILDLEKIEAGKLELRLEQQRPSELVELTLTGIAGYAEHAQVRLRSDLPPLPPIRADKDRLVQVLTNLVSNAIKFSPAQGEVTVEASAGDGTVRFSVRDQGPAIPPELQSRLFEKFRQLDGSDARAKGGTGLGLAICKQLVEQHGGRIWVESAPAAGSAFHFELPEDPTAAALPQVVRPAPGRRVLLVEDDADLAVVLERLLAAAGYQPCRAGTVKEAQRAMEASPPEIVMLDLRLPDGSGLDVLTWMRNRAATEAVPVVILSGRPGTERLGGFEVVDWLQKPFEEGRLLRALRSALRRGSPARELVGDDDPEARAVISAQLAAIGAECLEAGDGKEAVEAARRHQPDLIVLDVGMPEMDGFDVVEALKGEDGGSTPLVVYTGRELSDSDRKRLTLGITRHLTKSRATETEFVAVIGALLDGVAPHRSAA